MEARKYTTKKKIADSVSLSIFMTSNEICKPVFIFVEISHSGRLLYGAGPRSAVDRAPDL